MSGQYEARAGQGRIPWLLAVAVAVIGLALSAWYLRREQRSAADYLASTFTAATDRMATSIDHRLNTYQGAMRGVQGFFRASEHVLHEEFRSYVDSLQIDRNLPGVQAVGFVRLVSPAGLEEHIQQQRAAIYPGYQISPPGARDGYAPITYIEPLADNLAALGYDVFTNSAARAAMESALALNDIAITSLIMLVQDADTADVYSFVMYLPVYTAGAPLDTLADRRVAIAGWVDVPFRINDFLAGLAGEFHPDIYLEIHDGEPDLDSRMYYSSLASGQHDIDTAHLLVRQQLGIGGREWTLLMNSTPSFEQSVNAGSHSLLVITAGSAVTLLLSLLVWLMANARYSAEARFRRVFDNAGEGILVFSRDYRLLDANESALKMLDYNKAELRRVRLPALVDKDAQALDRDLSATGPGRTVSAEWQHRKKDGSTFPAEVSVGMLNKGSYFSVLRDMTGTRQAQARIHRLTQLYKALSSTNHAILRRKDEAELFPLVCRIAVEFGGMAMAWVGQIEPGGTRIIPVAATGKGQDYLDNVRVSSSADEAEGRGPTGTALRENHPVIVDDYLHDPSTKPWHAIAAEYGWKSAATFPVQRGGKPFAVLSVYHPHVAAFDTEAIALLEEMAGDISFALENFDREDERLKSALALAESEAKMSVILENVGASIYLKDTEGRYLFANQQMLDLLGVTNAEIIGSTDDKFFDEATVRQVRDNDERVLLHGEVLQREEVNRIAKTGEIVTHWSVKLPLRRDDGAIYALCGISTDITERKARDERIEFLSNYDVLTMLPNRELLRDRARLALATAQKSKGRVALLCIDIDRFKIVNESLGPSVGDQLLQEFARRLSLEIQPDQTLCRQGGDDFILLMPGCNAEAAAHKARQILETTTRPFILQDQRMVVSSCVGIALYPDDARDFEQLARSADAALFRAKRAGPGNFQFFTRQMHEHANEVLQIESELRQAIELEQLLIHYQPQVDLGTRKIVGLEALIRWRHPVRGLMSPVLFIPIAEESGLIVEIGTWVLREAVRQSMAWQAEGLPAVPVAVNLSALQFRQPDFYGTVIRVLNESGLAPGLLELEITEGVAMEDSEYTINLLTRLHEHGVSLSIDDFGMGYSSLSYLKRYPINTLKIDQSFVQGLGCNSGDEAIVNAIIAMARSLGFKTLAEGVETAAQLDYLSHNECDQVQGFLFSEPLPPAELATLLRKGATLQV